MLSKLKVVFFPQWFCNVVQSYCCCLLHRENILGSSKLTLAPSHSVYNSPTIFLSRAFLRCLRDCAREDVFSSSVCCVLLSSSCRAEIWLSREGTCFSNSFVLACSVRSWCCKEEMEESRASTVPWDVWWREEKREEKWERHDRKRS